MFILRFYKLQKKNNITGTEGARKSWTDNKMGLTPEK